MDIISRKEALSLGLKKFYTGKPCKHGHICEQYVSSGCITCVSDNASKWKKENKERHSQLNRKSFRNSPKQQAAHNAESLLRAKKYPEKARYAAAKRRALKLQATPLWANQELMKDMYKEAALKGMHVDHIIPLNNPLVCGLHCEFNLQLLPAKENLSKSNKFNISN